MPMNIANSGRVNNGSPPSDYRVLQRGGPK